MEFGKHIGKGLWGFADKGLTILYGFGFILLVVRILPPVEYGSFVLIQAIFTLLLAMGASFALQPLIKFVSGTENYGSLLTVCALFYIGFVALVSGLLFLCRLQLAHLLNAPHSERILQLILYVPLLLLGASGKSFFVALLQTRFRIQQIFWIDSVYFVGGLILFFGARRMGMLSTAEDLLRISIVAQILSSLLAVILAWKLIRFEWTLHREATRQVWDFGKYSLASAVSSAINTQLDVFLVTHILGLAQVAVLGVVKIFIRIFNVFTQVIQLFLIPAAAKLDARKDTLSMQALIEKSICFSTLSLLPILLIFLFGADLIILLLYAGKYTDAAFPLRIAGLLAILTPWKAVLSSIIIGMGKVKEGLYLSGLSFGVSVIVYIILIPLFGVSGAVGGSVISSFVMSVAVTRLVRKWVPVKIADIIGRTRDIVAFLQKKWQGQGRGTEV